MDTITASLATIPGRVRALTQTIESLYDQVDLIQVYLNGFGRRIPRVLTKGSKIRVFRSREETFGDRGDAGKFYRTQEHRGWRLVCDDDLVFPGDFMNVMIAKVESYERKCLVGTHGAILDETVEDYYRDRTVIDRHHSRPDDVFVHVLATNSMVFHSSTITLTDRDFPLPNMADIWLALKAQEQKVGLVVAAAPGDWIPDADYNANQSIYRRRYRRGGNAWMQTRFVQTRDDWRLWKPA